MARRITQESDNTQNLNWIKLKLMGIYIASIQIPVAQFYGSNSIVEKLLTCPIGLCACKDWLSED
jgi:hypothetical protein